ncbi:LysR family transcriptional regulator [Streptomyces sp. KR80]|uniref:LysR family transcriptional regulator n=1 Tax=Streptomyces sp. KR80 TaxID=3457426 RepID=UPI003FCF6365
MASIDVMVAGDIGEMDLDLRRLRSFVAVAERLHFGQAAVALHITQPALSRQIRQLEQDLGVELFARTSREVALTPAGEQLLQDAERLLAASQAALERVRRADAGGRSLTVGFMLGVDIAPVVRAFSERHPGVEVGLERLRWWNHGQAVLEGRVDVGVVRLPIASEGLTLLPLYTEPVRVTLPTEHPLAGQAAVSVADLADEPVFGYAEASPAWNAFWSIDPRPDGTRPRQGPLVHDMEEIVEYVRGGRGVAFLPATVTAAFPRDDVTYVPVIDAPLGQIVLAWQAGRQSPLITDLADVARRTLPGENA